jgi:hypothetical protein
MTPLDGGSTFIANDSNWFEVRSLPFNSFPLFPTMLRFHAMNRFSSPESSESETVTPQNKDLPRFPQENDPESSMKFHIKLTVVAILLRRDEEKANTRMRFQLQSSISTLY